MLSLAIFWFSVSLLFALLEIEIEGKFGWSEKTQTWRLPSIRQPKIIVWLMGGKILTGYHSLLFPLVFLLTHVPFFYSQAWSISAEFRTLAIYFAWTPLWDYLWIVWNPFFGITKIKSVAWYKHEKIVFGMFPFSTVLQWSLSFICAGLACLVERSYNPLWDHLMFVIYLSLFSIGISFVCVPLYRKCYEKMQKQSLPKEG